MRDTIYREDAIEAVKSTKPIVRSTERNWGKMIAEQHSKELVKALKSLPSAEAVQGEWIYNPKDAIELMFAKPKCSECGFESSDGGNFCPNCGADMRGEDK